MIVWASHIDCKGPEIGVFSFVEVRSTSNRFPVIIQTANRSSKPVRRFNFWARPNPRVGFASCRVVELTRRVVEPPGASGLRGTPSQALGL